ncbi:MAG TPA: gamma-glutamylcyclotransferase [Albitalea sp.]|uniref:gamma-glutamylcyclotransferase n=1 Tax=Piscinibacter sp. TaxID=1903157 RepID=UPI002ED43B53
MNPTLKALEDESKATRERLRSGTLLDAWRAQSPAGVTLRSDAELDESLADMLRSHDTAEDMHVFGYGSLMWNPALEYTEVLSARVQGWHRSFCLRQVFGRGSAQKPGVMLALDRGGACTGRLFRIAATQVEAELRLLWRREMVGGAYDARWVPVLAGDRRLRALTFVINRRHPRYLGGTPVDQIAHLLRTGEGMLGTSRSYFEALSRTLESLSIRDAGIERLRGALSMAEVSEQSLSPG